MFRPVTIFLIIFIIFFGGSAILIHSLESASPQGTVDPSTLTGLYDPSARTAIFNNRIVSVPSVIAQTKETPRNVLGQATGQKKIEIDLTHQRLYAYEGDTQVYNFLISSGLWGKTPTGSFTIWGKFRYVRMTGGSKALHTYYDLPNVPFTMFFANDQIPKWKGFGIHGTYWHSNFGHPMSHGCINMKTEEAALLYSWANPQVDLNSSILSTNSNPGTPVVIYGEAPAS